MGSAVLGRVAGGGSGDSLASPSPSLSPAVGGRGAYLPTFPLSLLSLLPGARGQNRATEGGRGEEGAKTRSVRQRPPARSSLALAPFTQLVRTVRRRKEAKSADQPNRGSNDAAFGKQMNMRDRIGTVIN